MVQRREGKEWKRERKVGNGRELGRQGVVERQEGRQVGQGMVENQVRRDI